MKRLMGSIVVMALGFLGPAAVAHADGQDTEEEAWARLNEQINADFEAGRLTPDKGETELAHEDGIQPASSSGGSNQGTGTTKGYIGYYPQRSGVILVTDDKFGGIIPTGHAGIIYSRDSTVEAINTGVKVMGNKWYMDKKQVYGVTVRGTSTAQDAKAADWAHAQVDKPYNLAFFNVDQRDSFYCAQLVWAAFKDLYGIDLNTEENGKAIHPMELVKTPNTKLVYKMRP